MNFEHRHNISPETESLVGEDTDIEIKEQQKIVLESEYRQPDQDGLEYVIFNLRLSDGGLVKLAFKNEEQLPSFDVKDSQVIMVGNIPYARSTIAISDFTQDYQYKSSNQLYQLGSTRQFTKSYPLEVRVGLSGEDLRDRNGDSSFSDIPKLPDIFERESESLLLVNSDVESVIEAANYLRLQNNQEGLEFTSIEIGRLEDVIIDLSRNEDGILESQISATRKILLERLLQGKDAALGLGEEVKHSTRRVFPYAIAHALERFEWSRETMDKEMLSYIEKTSPEAYLPHRESQTKTIKMEHSALERLKVYLEGYMESGSTDYPLTEKEIQELNKHVLVHMTQYPPLVADNGVNYYIPTTGSAYDKKMPRLTVHFSVDGIATAAAVTQGNWEEYPYAVIAPLGEMIRYNGPMASTNTADTWWVVDPTEKQGVILPPDTTVLKTDKQQVDGLESVGGVDIEELEEGVAIKDFLLKKYNVVAKTVGNRGWVSGHDSFSMRMAELFPGVSDQVHSGYEVVNLEKIIFQYFKEVVKTDNKEKLQKAIEKDGGKSLPISEEELIKINQILETPSSLMIDAISSDTIEQINHIFQGHYTGNIVSKELGRYLVKLGII